ncbi:hyaluronidase-4-like isoform X3 [Tamandua tetradactyla]|uniref:hyaluronidase-4-like isoform X3 n=1 Tax=Tamandua tetradactyla TaxID=48850 RepID=UPI00405391CD
MCHLLALVFWEDSLAVFCPTDYLEVGIKEPSFIWDMMDETGIKRKPQTMCSLWVAWLGVLQLFIRVSHMATKPEMPPVIKNQPFNIFWAAPTMQCRHFFNVDLNLKLFNIISNSLETQSGPIIAIFYPHELGHYPYFSQDGKSFNGGIPQNMSLSKHLRKTADDIEKIIPSWRTEELVVIDWENWKPQWDRNWGNKVIYKKHSLAFTRNHHPDWSDTKVKTVAQQEFENAGRNFMNITLTLALEMRPKCLWGFYLYPDCYNYDYRINSQIYTGNCPNDEIFRNNQLMWLWEKSTALYPSIYLDKILNSSLNALKFVHYRVREAMRIAEMARHDYVLPVFIFSRPFYLHSMEALSQETCLSLQQFIQGRLGHYAVNVTSATQLCSKRLCNNNGRCVRKIPESFFYLHMPESSSKKYNHKSLSFTVSQKIKLKIERDMNNGFACHCYYGWHGESCQHSSSVLLKGKNKASTANLPVFLSMIFSVILLIFLILYYNVIFSLIY